MLSRSALRSSKNAYTCLNCAQHRSYASSTSAALNFESSKAAGTNLVTKNTPGPTSSLAFVAKAGTRYQWLPALSEGLQHYAFKNTEKRFAVRIIRETELLGSEIFCNRTREAVVFGAKFFREDLPYFVELFAEVASETKYQQYAIDEVIAPVIAEHHHRFLSDPTAVALNAAHEVAYHRGLGNSLYPVGPSATPKLLAPEVEAYAAVAYAKNNFALVGNGIEQAELSKWTGEFFKDVPATAPSGLPVIEQGAAKYFGGETRIAHSAGSAVVIAFEGSSLIGGASHKPAIDALATLLGGQAAVKWSTGTSILAKAVAAHPGVKVKTESTQYTDTGLLNVIVSGPHKAVAAAVKDVAAAIKSLGSSAPSSEDLKKAVASAKFKAYDLETSEVPQFDIIGLGGIAGQIKSSEAALKGISSLSADAVKTAAKELLKGKVTVVSVGDLNQLPYAEELGLTV